MADIDDSLKPERYCVSVNVKSAVNAPQNNKLINIFLWKLSYNFYLHYTQLACGLNGIDTIDIKQETYDVAFSPLRGQFNV